MDRNSEDRITADPALLVGKPVVSGTRIPVELVIELLERGYARDQILQQYPSLTMEDIDACLAYVRELLQSERVFPVPA